MKCQNELLIFCQNVKFVRQKEGLSKKKMAEMMGVGRYGLDLIERGIVPNHLTVNTILNFCFSFVFL